MTPYVPVIVLDDSDSDVEIIKVERCDSAPESSYQNIASSSEVSGRKHERVVSAHEEVAYTTSQETATSTLAGSPIRSFRDTESVSPKKPRNARVGSTIYMDPPVPSLGPRSPPLPPRDSIQNDSSVRSSSNTSTPTTRGRYHNARFFASDFTDMEEEQRRDDPDNKERYLRYPDISRRTRYVVDEYGNYKEPTEQEKQWMEEDRLRRADEESRYTRSQPRGYLVDFHVPPPDPPKRRDPKEEDKNKPKSPSLYETMTARDKEIMYKDIKKTIGRLRAARLRREGSDEDEYEDQMQEEKKPGKKPGDGYIEGLLPHGAPYVPRGDSHWYPGM